MNVEDRQESVVRAPTTVRVRETAMNAQDRSQQYEQDHHGPARESDHEHLHGEASAVPDTHHVFRAAATGRADVLGTAGMGVLQRSVGNAALGPMIQRFRAGTPERSDEESRSPVHDVISSGGGAPL
ncbi:hypothetical protein ACWD3X_37575, partial [Streptomyces sp. NPDC002666]